MALGDDFDEVGGRQDPLESFVLVDDDDRADAVLEHRFARILDERVGRDGVEVGRHEPCDENVIHVRTCHSATY